MKMILRENLLKIQEVFLYMCVLNAEIELYYVVEKKIDILISSKLFF